MLSKVMLRFVCTSMLLLSGCTRPIEVSAVKPSTDFSGLTPYERQQSYNWIAFDVVVPASVARSIRRWQLSNVTLQVFHCNNPDDAYPANARLGGKLFDYEDLKEPLSSSVRLTFYVPQEPERQQATSCATLDARGYSPVFLRSHTFRLSPMRMTFPHYDEKSGRITST